MAEYIEREFMISKLKEHLRKYPDACYSVAEIILILNEAPAAVVVEVKHGQWVQKPARLGSNYKLYGCSLCGWTFTFKPDYCFCPRCGAYMKGCVENDS